MRSKNAADISVSLLTVSMMMVLLHDGITEELDDVTANDDVLSSCTSTEQRRSNVGSAAAANCDPAAAAASAGRSTKR